MTQQMYQLIIDQSPIATVCHRVTLNQMDEPTDSVITHVNRAYEGLAGCTPGQLLGASMQESMGTLQLQGLDWPAFLKETVRDGGVVRVTRYAQRDHVWYRISGQTLLPGYIVTYIEVVSAPELGDMILRMQDFYQFVIDVFDHTTAFIFAYDTQTQELLYANQYAKREFGDLVGKQYMDMVSGMKQDAPLELNMQPGLQEEGEQGTDRRRYYYRHQNNGKWYACNDHPIRWIDGREGRMHVGIDITEVRDALQALKESEARLKLIQQTAHIGGWEMNLATRSLNWSEELFHLLGVAPNSVQPSHALLYEHVHPEDRAHIQALIEHSVEHGSDYKTEIRFVGPNGQQRHIQAQGIVHRDERGRPIKRVGSILDITEKKEALLNLEKEEKRLRITLMSVGDGVISTDQNGKVELLNPMAERLTGWTQAQAQGQPIEAVFHIIDEKTRKISPSPVRAVLATGESATLQSHTLLVCRDGDQRYIADSAAPILDDQGQITGVVLVFRDVTAEREKEQEILYLGYHDSLTGLYNRRYLQEVIARVDRQENLPISVIFADVNGLKIVNDAFGHAMGDQLIKLAAQAISQSLRKTDFATRWGGDEFVVLLPGTDAEQAARICRRIRRHIAGANADPVNLSMSLGTATKTEVGQSIEELMGLAENRMHRQKAVESGSVRGSTINTIVTTLHEKSPQEGRHSQNVSELCKKIGLAMGLPEEEIAELGIIGLMHDIGKIMIDASILNKQGPLTEEEWLQIRRHPEIGSRILSASNDMALIAPFILGHHERFDGSGYPKGLVGEEIPLKTRILTVADAYDAMRMGRPYLPRLDHQQVIDEMHASTGKQFDPQIVQVFLEKVLPGLEAEPVPSPNA